MAMLSSKQRRFNQGLLENDTALYGQLSRFEEHINQELTKQIVLAEGIEKSHKSNLQTAIQILEYKDETKKEEKRLADLEKKRAAAAAKAAKEQARLAKEKADRDREEAERLALNAKFEDMTSKERAKALTLDNQNRAARIALIDNELERATAQLELETDLVNQKIEDIEKAKNC